MSAVSDRLVTQALRSLGYVSQLRSVRGRVRLGTVLGGMMMRLDAKRRAITQDNVRRAFPDRSENEIEKIVRGSYDNLGITLAELLAFPSMTQHDVMQQMQIPGIERVAERAAKGLPNVLISGHYGNWELLALAGGLHAKTPFVIVAHPLSNQSADVLLNSYRTQFGNRIIPMHNAARELVRVMQQGGTVAFLADQHADGNQNRSFPFFGRPTPTYEAPAALSLKFKAPMFYAFARRHEDGTYTAPLSELRSDDCTSSPEGIAELTRRHVAALENTIRDVPELWSWQHRRWRDE